MKPEDCPKFISCNAPLCPLDDGILRRVHLEGEAVCVYLREYAKPGGKDFLEGDVATEHFEAIREAFPIVLASYAPIRKALKRASKSPSKLRMNPRENGHG